ncbi:MAG TPA: VWA domain-containing protein [Candidatus Acidoferrum sp.]|nr:VWA domain-containing protein [Candidatus Acidoferrum sp.]
MTPLRAHSIALLTFAAFLSSGIAFTQDNPNRPPWAQKSKTNSKSSSKSTTSSPSSNAPPDGEPGKIVQPTQPPPADDPQEAAAQRNRIRVNVNLVTVLVSVLDEHNRPAPDLPLEAFQLFEEGVEQKINIFEPETSQPLDLALMIDASLSAHKEISFEQEAAAHFIRQVLRPGDRLSVFSFDEDVAQRAAFSDNVAALQDAVRKIPNGAGTSIYDAVLLGSRALARRGEDRRRVIILVTDAGETTSRYDFDSARKEAVRSNTLLYTVVIRPVKNESGRNTAGEHALETMTDTTGGAMFYPDTPQELGAIFDRIDRELRTQYRLAYYPSPRGPANTYRSIEVKVTTGHYQVRHRKSYLTAPQ